MEPLFIKTEEQPLDVSVLYLTEKETDLSGYSFSPAELEYLNNQRKKDKRNIHVNSYFKWSYLIVTDTNLPEHELLEDIRIQASALYSTLKKNNHRQLLVVDTLSQPFRLKALLEGLALSHYQFLRHKSTDEDTRNKLEQIQVLSDTIGEKELQQWQVVTGAVYHARDLVNEPLSSLNAVQLGEAFQEMAREAGFSIEVFNKKKIEALRMNGLLAVNRGSVDPPSFSVMEWNPTEVRNSRPIVLVGKGVVYDTGGISLKPSSSMGDMKSDMAGAAVVVGILYAAARNKIPVRLIGLVPATDNRPGGNAYTPGDVVTMHDETTVEVVNTDAEGRMILADALSFARQFDPELVFDFATLTGSASVAIGPQGIVTMGNADETVFEQLIQSGLNTYERLVRLPLWKEYKEMIKSDVADLKNAGGREAGAITAGKFLEHFTRYSWVHFDIAPTAFLEKHDSYRGKGGTGTGIRLMYDFLNQYTAK
ncbi:MAG TPA: leucyl aminopeptidase [Bacteroidales bacterium]|nr:leucyl aminopeptidase [Bacteroidales bacterium]